jgi:acetyl-CoA carboxylase biotin carboxyl carrier protein
LELKDIKELIRYFDRSGIAEMEIENGDSRLYLSKSKAQEQYVEASSSEPAARKQMLSADKEQNESKVENTIESPMIGTFYSAPSPGAEAYIRVGDIAEKGQTLCIIEAMKIMNTIEAEYRMKIVKILMENGAPVEYGQAIFVVEAL